MGTYVIEFNNYFGTYDIMINPKYFINTVTSGKPRLPRKIKKKLKKIMGPGFFKSIMNGYKRYENNQELFKKWS